MTHDHLDNWIDAIEWFHGDDYLRVVEAIDRDEDDGKCVLPPPENILNPFTWFSPNDTRVVIINNEPHLSAEHATGLPMSVSPECDDIPALTQNILSELDLDIGVIAEHGCLNSWAAQGVLLLNISMSVRENESGSHWNIGWQGLIDDVVRYVNRNTEKSAFLFWGQPAQAKRVMVNHRHLVVNSNSPHPDVADKGFFGSRPFSKTNEFFRKNDQLPIDWRLD